MSAPDQPPLKKTQSAAGDGTPSVVEASKSVGEGTTATAVVETEVVETNGKAPEQTPVVTEPSEKASEPALVVTEPTSETTTSVEAAPASNAEEKAISDKTETSPQAATTAVVPPPLESVATGGGGAGGEGREASDVSVEQNGKPNEAQQVSAADAATRVPPLESVSEGASVAGVVDESEVRKNAEASNNALQLATLGAGAGAGAAEPSKSVAPPPSKEAPVKEILLTFQQAHKLNSRMPKGYKLVPISIEKGFQTAAFETAKRSRKPKIVADIGETKDEDLSQALKSSLTPRNSKKSSSKKAARSAPPSTPVYAPATPITPATTKIQALKQRLAFLKAQAAGQAPSAPMAAAPVTPVHPPPPSPYMHPGYGYPPGYPPYGTPFHPPATPGPYPYPYGAPPYGYPPGAQPTPARQRKSTKKKPRKRNMDQDFSDDERKPKRRRTPKTSSAKKSAKGKTWLQKSKLILGSLMKKEKMKIFNKPVDPVMDHVPDYFQRVRHPMDLGTVKRRLDKHHYGSPEEFAADVDQVWQNSFIYHAPGSYVYKLAAKCQALFKKEYRSKRLNTTPRGGRPPTPIDGSKSEQYLKRIQDRIGEVRSNTPRSHNTPQHPAPAPVPSVGSLTTAESEKLAAELQNKLGLLKTEQLKQVLDIAKKGGFPATKSSDGEYELTLAKMDSKTLTKLQVFIDASIAARPDSVRRAASTPGPLGGAGDKSDSSSSSSSDSDSDSDSD